MDFDTAQGVRYEIVEWWDHQGVYHPGAPSDEHLLDDAIQVTGHIKSHGGDDLYFTVFSDDGWEPEEIQDDFDDAYHHYL